MTITSFVSSLVLFLFLVFEANITPLESLHLMGWFPVDFSEIARSLLLVILLFLGPLFEAGIADAQWQIWVSPSSIKYSLSRWMNWRNYIAVRYSVYSHGIHTTPLTYHPGPDYRRSCLPLNSRNAPSPCRYFCHTHCFPHSSLFWHRPHQSPVRIPLRLSLAIAPDPDYQHYFPVWLHHGVRLARDVRVCSYSFPTGSNFDPFLL